MALSSISGGMSSCLRYCPSKVGGLFSNELRDCVSKHQLESPSALRRAEGVVMDLASRLINQLNAFCFPSQDAAYSRVRRTCYTDVSTRNAALSTAEATMCQNIRNTVNAARVDTETTRSTFLSSIGVNIDRTDSVGDIAREIRDSYSSAINDLASAGSSASGNSCNSNMASILSHLNSAAAHISNAESTCQNDGGGLLCVLSSDHLSEAPDMSAVISDVNGHSATYNSNVATINSTPICTPPPPPPTTLAPTDPPTTLAPTNPPTTPAPTNPPTTPAPTNPPETPAPTNPPETPAPTNPPETLAPTNPPETLAPTNPPETLAPTNPPTTPAPTDPPETLAPTNPPTTPAPTDLPSDSETGAPSDPETGAPSDPETGAPSDPETGAPTDPETGAPTSSTAGSAVNSNMGKESESSDFFWVIGCVAGAVLFVFALVVLVRKYWSKGSDDRRAPLGMFTNPVYNPSRSNNGISRPDNGINGTGEAQYEEVGHLLYESPNNLKQILEFDLQRLAEHFNIRSLDTNAIFNALLGSDGREDGYLYRLSDVFSSVENLSAVTIPGSPIQRLDLGMLLSDVYADGAFMCKVKDLAVNPANSQFKQFLYNDGLEADSLLNVPQIDRLTHLIEVVSVCRRYLSGDVVLLYDAAGSSGGPPVYDFATSSGGRPVYDSADPHLNSHASQLAEYVYQGDGQPSTDTVVYQTAAPGTTGFYDNINGEHGEGPFGFDLDPGSAYILGGSNRPVISIDGGSEHVSA